MPQHQKSYKFSDIIREYRLATGFTQRDLAMMCGIGQSSLCRIERGHTIPSVNTIRLLCIPLKADLYQFLMLAAFTIIEQPDFDEEKLAGIIDVLRKEMPKKQKAGTR